jgi:multimeric flavodoxin WrbA
MKNILVITGSPRKSGNSGLLANAFIEGAKQKRQGIILCCFKQEGKEF